MIDAVTAQGRITAAYAAIITRNGQRHGDWVMLSDLRNEVGETINRHVMDAALRQLDLRPGVNLVPESNQKALTVADCESAVWIGCQWKHAISVQ